MSHKYGVERDKPRLKTHKRERLNRCNGQAFYVQQGDNNMNHQILADIELNRKISLFQKAVEAYALNRTLENSMAVAKAKADLACFVWGG